MRGVRAILIGMSLAAIGSSVDAASRPMTLQKLVALETRARGGAKALDAIETLRVDVRIEEPDVNAYGRWYGRTDGKMRVDIFAHSTCKRVWSEGIDNKGAWDWPGDASGPEDESAGGATALRHGVEFNMFGLHRFAERGNKLELLGLDRDQGAKSYVIKITMADGFETYRYIDPVSHLIVRSRDFRAFHPDLDPKKSWIETRFSNFRRNHGVIDPFASEDWDLMSGKAIGHSTTLRRDINPIVPDELLSRYAVPAPYC